jgi:ubiquinone biosynthesis protein
VINPIRRIRTFGRLSHIVNRAMRHGLGYFLEQVGLARGGRDGRSPDDASLPPLGRRVRLFLQELGPTFIKLGQVAASRGDIVPEDVVSELRKLQDEVPPDPSERVLAVIDAEFDRPRDALFATLSETPLAAASIAQVYAATTGSGDDVIVKVQRPGVERIIECDIDTLRYVAQQAEARIPIARRYSPTSFVEEFAEIISDELVFTHEAHNCEYMASHYRDHHRVYFPKIYWDLTSRRVLTMERLHGIRIKDVEELGRAGHDLKALARNLATHILEQILLFGFVHGDPHGGNVLVLPDGRLGFLDFGIVCRLDPTLRENLVRLFSAIFAQDAEEVVDVLF